VSADLASSDRSEVKRPPSRATSVACVGWGLSCEISLSGDASHQARAVSGSSRPETSYLGGGGLGGPDADVTKDNR
jgi:hypothetical protein